MKHIISYLFLIILICFTTPSKSDVLLNVQVSNYGNNCTNFGPAIEMLCGVSAQNSSEATLLTLTILGSTRAVQPNDPPPITKLYFPDMVSIIFQKTTMMMNQSLNVLSFLDSPVNSKLKSISTYINGITPGFPKNILKTLKTLTLDTNSTLAFVAGDIYPNLQILSICLTDLGTLFTFTQESFPNLKQMFVVIYIILVLSMLLIIFDINRYIHCSYVSDRSIRFDSNNISIISVTDTTNNNNGYELLRGSLLTKLEVRNSILNTTNLLNSPLESFDLSKNNLVPPIPDYSSISPNLVLTNNLGISGALPDFLCSYRGLNFINTSITSVPDCVSCSWDTMKNSFPLSVAPALPYTCNALIDKTSFILKTPQQYIDITGKNLGFDISNPKVEVVVPNSLFSLTRNISWAVDLSTYTVVEMNGVFDSTMAYSAKVNNTDCKIILKSDQLLKCNLSSYLNDGLVSISLENQIQVIQLSQQYTQEYPILSSWSPIDTNGGYLILSGFFGTKDTNNQVKLNNEQCSINSKNETTIVCYLQEGIASGYQKLVIFIDLKSYETTIKVDNAVVPNDCGRDDKCNGNGVCVSEKCKCSDGFGGFYCENTIANSTIVKNETTPVVSVVSNDVQFDFNFYAIQEIDSTDNIVSELNITSWNFKNDTDGDITNFYYHLNVSSPEVITLIQHSPKERTVEFAGITSYLPPNSLKVSITINGWQFQSNLNNLRVLFNTKIEDQVDKCGDQLDSFGKDTNDDLKYIRIVKDNSVFYGSFIDRIMSDGKPTSTRNQVISTNKETGTTLIGIQVPQCYNCIIDPNFSVLLQSEPECNDGGISKQTIIIVATVVGGAVLLSLLMLLGIYLKKKRGRVYNLFTASNILGQSFLTNNNTTATPNIPCSATITNNNVQQSNNNKQKKTNQKSIHSTFSKLRHKWPIKLEGKKMADYILQGIEKETTTFKNETGVTPHLVVIYVGENTQIESYIKQKKDSCEKVGFKFTLDRFSSNIQPAQLMKKIEYHSADENVSGIIVQLPLPGHLNAHTIIQSINPLKDVDGLNSLNMAQIFLGKKAIFLPCTPDGILELLKQYNFKIEGANVVVVGRSNLVGRTIATLLSQKNLNHPSIQGGASVTLLHRFSKDIRQHLKNADLIISATGCSGLIKKDDIKEGVVLIDVGISYVDDPTKKKGYRMVGDVHPDAYSKAMAFTPVPGGLN
ncbi:hypothetical protein PPL_01825 [Heterostelium album PN500]|uniref:methenyltetrahydrofolate cyclohydrolase n=1 Tax=Heterostelium pallidum (strain ATCC 26659 / Pp 5 / PN500) TaxID=670386 RepID=D3B0K8_HETP5|nr:hypothetical protein PPL_01825 [Heterostelium album PN500]EFA84832.1 hypothetical protein PPL_01825 [Heterostelium album PN500]|eukprot:XP_020436943.1 hypothetical protein PPL_01825 [Heterostelium album PN500]